MTGGQIMKNLRWISIALCILILTGMPVYGETLVTEASTTEIIEPVITKLTLQEAIDFALTNSIDYELTKLELQKSEVQYQQNKKAVRSLQDFYDLDINIPRTYEVTADDNVNRAMIKNGASLRQVELAWNIANWNLVKKENQIKYNVEKAYFDLKKAETEVKIANENLALSQKQFEFGKLRFQVGLMSKQQLLGLELGLSQAKSGFDASDMAYKLQQMSFKNTIGMDLGIRVELIDTLEKKSYEPIILDDSIKLAFENNVNLKIAEESYEIQQLVLKATSGRFPEITFRYREKATEVAKAEQTLMTVKNGIEMGVRSSYLGLITAEKQIETFKLAVQQATEALRIAELSFELGQNTATEVAQANLNLMNAKKNLAQQIHAYNLALLDFEYSTGIGK